MARDRKAIIKLILENDRFQKSLKDSKKKWSKFGRGMARGAKSTVSKISSLGAVVGGIGFASVAQDTVKFETALTRLGIQANASTGQVNSWRKQIDELSMSTGVSRDQILEGARAFVSMTGDVKGAEKLMGVFTRTASASGAEMGDIAQAAAALQKTMNIDASDMERAMSIVLKGGKAGSVELKEMAGLLGGVAPQFAKFGEQGAAGLARLNAAFQAASPEFGFSGAETQTGLRSFMTSIEKNAKRIKKVTGVDVYGDDGNLRNFRDVIVDLGKAEEKGKNLFQALGRAEGVRLQRALYNQLDTWDQIYEASKNARDVQDDSARFQESAAGRYQRSINNLKQAIAKAFTPERIEKFGNALEAIAKLAAMISDNLGTAVALWAGSKIAPTLLGTGMNLGLSAAAGAAQGTALGASMGSAGFLKSLGLAGLAGAAGYAAGSLLRLIPGVDEAFDALVGFAGDLFGLGDKGAQKGDQNTISGIDARVREGRMTAEEGAAAKAKLSKAFDFRGRNNLVDKIAREALAGGVSREQIAKNLAGGKAAGAAQAVIDQMRAGKGAEEEIRKLTKLIAGKEITLKVDGKVLAETTMNAITNRIR